MNFHINSDYKIIDDMLPSEVEPTFVNDAPVPNPWDSLDKYLEGMPVPSTASEPVYNEIGLDEVGRYAKDVFEVARAMHTLANAEDVAQENKNDE